MADIRIEKKHNLDFETARARATEWLNEAQAEHGLTVNVDQGAERDIASIKRKGIDGTATLDADRLLFEANLSWFAKPLKGQIEQILKSGIETYFS